MVHVGMHTIIMGYYLDIMVYYGIYFINTMTGWWYTYPSEKYDESSVGMMKFPIDGK